ncbi:MAG: hypothetical protein HY313_09685 [Acidobacteria bacterium]|nr:hypothetical protein [Acidobacteriota bacterium]
MKMVVVGGNSRDIGKTSVVAGLIRALPHYRWTAIKLTQYPAESVYLANEEHNDTPPEQPFVIQEEVDRSGKTDTSRFLGAGARRALWVRVRPGALAMAIPALRQAIVHDEYVIVESNSILRFYQPNVYLTLLDPAQKDFKPSAQEFLHRADACLVLEPGLKHSRWEDIPLDSLRNKPVFLIGRDLLIATEIAAFVEKRLLTTGDALVLAGS